VDPGLIALVALKIATIASDGIAARVACDRLEGAIRVDHAKIAIPRVRDNDALINLIRRYAQGVCKTGLEIPLPRSASVGEKFGQEASNGLCHAKATGMLPASRPAFAGPPAAETTLPR
jgi:hypothetical protein